MIRPLLLALALIPTGPHAPAAEEPPFTRTMDVVYGRKHGLALTFDVFTPAGKPNGLGLIFVVSGGWFSAHEAITPAFLEPMLRRGYTVFAVLHGSQPRYTIPEAVDDIDRATHYIHYHAREYKIDPDRLGIYGISAGGHLALMQATAGDAGRPNPLDPVVRTSARVRAVAAFFPPTDFLNYGKPGVNGIGRGPLHAFFPAFDFHDFDVKANRYELIRDESRIAEIGRKISPITHITRDDPPALIIHGESDTLVPIQQAESFVARLREAGVAAKLVPKPGKAHGWPDLREDLATVADWFDAHLKPTAPSPSR